MVPSTKSSKARTSSLCADLTVCRVCHRAPLTAGFGAGHTAEREAIKKALNNGGAAILCRHGNTNWAEQARFGRHFTSSQRSKRPAQRTLAALGRVEGRASHDAFKMHGIAISAAYSKWRARTREVGTLASLHHTF